MARRSSRCFHYISPWATSLREGARFVRENALGVSCSLLPISGFFDATVLWLCFDRVCRLGAGCAPEWSIARLGVPVSQHDMPVRRSTPLRVPRTIPRCREHRGKTGAAREALHGFEQP